MDTASDLFLREGIRVVGIDRLINEAGVARASLYQNFGSKDDLVVAYLDREHEVDRAGYERAVLRKDDPVARVLVIFDLAEAASRRSSYRGCPFLNAATEFPDPTHPVTSVVRRHRQWLLDCLTEELREAGVDQPATIAGQVQILYDGGLAGSKVSRSGKPIRSAKQMAESLVRPKRGTRQDRGSVRLGA
jgi:AcrR family transcriptional regulator